MANTFYVRTADKNQYVEAKFLTDVNGKLIVSSNPIQRSFNLFDASHNPIGTNTNGYIIVPASFDIKTAIDFGRSISQWKKLPIAGDLIGAPARFANAFQPNGWLDIQTNYNGTSGQSVPAFRDGASYIFGVAGRAAEYSLDTLKFGGGIVNLGQYLRDKVKDISGDVFNSPENARSMTDGSRSGRLEGWAAILTCDSGYQP
jgi:hypothetical protein